MERDDLIKQSRLDELLVKYKAQPVGNGYTDIIVRSENYMLLLRGITDLEIFVKALSWWDYLPKAETRTPLGIGGPVSGYYGGWFSEFCMCDDLPLFNNVKEQIPIIKEMIENKVIDSLEGSYLVSENKNITPAFWLEVDDNWRNPFGLKEYQN